MTLDEMMKVIINRLHEYFNVHYCTNDFTLSLDKWENDGETPQDMVFVFGLKEGFSYRIGLTNKNHQRVCVLINIPDYFIDCISNWEYVLEDYYEFAKKRIERAVVKDFIKGTFHINKPSIEVELIEDVELEDK